MIFFPLEVGVPPITAYGRLLEPPMDDYLPPPLVQGTPVSKAHPPFVPYFFLTVLYLGQGGGRYIN